MLKYDYERGDSMKSDEFRDYAKIIVKEYAYSHLDKQDNIGKEDFDVYVVWECYILGNSKALVSTTLADGMYYEVTYNQSKNEVYLDAYKKFENVVFDVVRKGE